ncbi:tRNA1(Val) (adenine(37)-N6)-methyltransferase [Vaginisenegalia massiliensis]|uniref:tRNA1(Val) (adenine(37)-N6)-methyltransferase n=1 Tax=Vaginisenegalia massiliensis TaxID=2058294 RepID=UPI000F5376B4|nr:tRNA1(Val) (adenine(37)-N6)-methyltransferase [Vaginisenegalia massiliensis]
MFEADKAPQLGPGERLDRFIREDLVIIQSQDYFNFSLDAVLLAHFTQIPRRNKLKIVDFCSGNGVIPLLLSAKTEVAIDAIELQPGLVEMAQRSAQLNGLQDRLHFQCMNLNDFMYQGSQYDIVTCNPPYFLVDNSKEVHHLTSLALARHELKLTLDQWVKKASQILKDKGRLFFVHRPDRLDDLMACLEKHHFAVYRMQFVHPKAGARANVLLVEAIYRGGRNGVRVEPPLVVYQDDNTYTPELQAIYYG